MAKFSIPCMVEKSTAAGVRYYWQPSATLKKAGWTPLKLGQNRAEAMRLAEARNLEVETWRLGGARPRQVKRMLQRATMAALIRQYREDDKYTKLAPNTQVTYSSALNFIEKWATDRTPGDIPVSAITIQRVEVFRDALMLPHPKTGEVKHHRAHNILRVLRTLFAYAKRKGIIETNSAEAFDLATPAPRDQIWDHEDIAAFSLAAHAIGYPGLAFAVELAEYIGQREEDMLKLQASQWREIQNLDPETQRVLAGDDGKVMGFFIRQGKTKRWVGIPIAGELRGRVEAAIAANAKLEVPVTTILTNDYSDRPWTKRQFIRKFVEAKERAVTPTEKDIATRGMKPHPALAELQFRDLRRTCVVRLGELGLEDGLISGISGHKLASIKKILEIYMPRTNKMAARAIVARIGHAARAAPAKGKQEQQG